MDADFVALATLLAPPAAPPPLVEQPAILDADDAPLIERVDPLPDEVRRFRAIVRDAVDARVTQLLRDIAVDVLARELRAAPCDIGALVARLAAERAADEPLRVRIASADKHAALPLAAVVDESLAQGDVIVECRSGTIDARLGTRLAAVLEAA